MSAEGEAKSRPLLWIALAVCLVGVLCGGAVAAGAGGWLYVRNQRMEKEAAEAARVAAEQAAEAARAAKDAENAAALTSAQKLYDAGQYDQALTALDSLLDTDPRNIDGWILHGRCMIKQKDDDHALEDFGRAVAIDPKRVDALQYRAFMFAQEQLYSEAIKDVDTILAMDASNGRAYKLRSDCDFQLGNMAKAREDAQKSCDLGYDDGCVAVKRLRSE